MLKILALTITTLTAASASLGWILSFKGDSLNGTTTDLSFYRALDIAWETSIGGGWALGHTLEDNSRISLYGQHGALILSYRRDASCHDTLAKSSWSRLGVGIDHVPIPLVRGICCVAVQSELDRHLRAMSAMPYDLLMAHAPLGLIAALFGPHPVLAIYRGPLRRRHRRRTGCCVGCGYCLTGNTSGDARNAAWLQQWDLRRPRADSFRRTCASVR